MGLGGGMALLAGKLQLARLPPSSSSGSGSGSGPSCCQQQQHFFQHQQQQQQHNLQAGLSLGRRHGGGAACPSVRAQRKEAPLLAGSDDDVVITSVRELADGSFHYTFGAGASPPPPQPSKRGEDLASSRAQHVLTPAPVQLPQRPPSRFSKHSPIPVRAGRAGGRGKEKQKQEQVQQQEQVQVQEQEVRRVKWRKDPGVPVRPKSAFVKRSPIPNPTSRPRCPVSLPAPVVLDDAVEEQPDESLPILPPPPPVSPPSPSPPRPLLVVNGVAREEYSNDRVPKAAEVSRSGGSKKAEAASKSAKGASAAATAESPVKAVQLPAPDHSPAPDAAAAAAAPSPSRPASKFVRKSPVSSQARKKSLQEPVVESKVVESTVVESREQRAVETKGAGAPVQGLVGEDSSQGSSVSKGGNSSVKGGSGNSKGSSSSTKGSSSKSNVQQAKEEEAVELPPVPPVRPESNFFRRSPIPRPLPAKPVQEVEVEPLQQRPPAPAPARRSPKKSSKEAARNAEPEAAVEEGKAPVDQDPETGGLEVQDPQAQKPPEDQLPADLAALTLVQLRGIAKARGLKGYSRLKKAELIALIQQ